MEDPIVISVMAGAVQDRFSGKAGSSLRCWTWGGSRSRIECAVGLSMFHGALLDSVDSTTLASSYDSMLYMDLVDEKYRDGGGLRDQDLVSTKVFVSDRDRAQITGRGVPFFSAREAEIHAFRKVANALLLGRQGNATVVVEGPPGAGKSALMSQFMEEMRSFPPAGER